MTAPALLICAAPALARIALTAWLLWLSCWMLLRWDTAYTELVQDIADLIMPVKDDGRD